MTTEENSRSKPPPPQELPSISTISSARITNHPKQDSVLSWIEFLIVFAIGLGVLAIMLSVMFGFPEGVSGRLNLLINTIENGWKIGIIILIPIFFRPVRFFLENVKKIGPADTQRPSEGPEGQCRR